MGSALREILGDVRTEELERWYLLLWSTSHGIAGLLVERIFSQLKSDGERQAFADRLLTRFVDSIPASTKVRAKPRPRRKR